MSAVNELSETFTSTPTKPRLSFPEPTSWLLIYSPLIPIAQAQGPSLEQRPGPRLRPQCPEQRPAKCPYLCAQSQSP